MSKNMSKNRRSESLLLIYVVIISLLNTVRNKEFFTLEIPEKTAQIMLILLVVLGISLGIWGLRNCFKKNYYTSFYKYCIMAASLLTITAAIISMVA